MGLLSMLGSFAFDLIGAVFVIGCLSALMCWVHLIKLRQDLYRMFNELQKEKKRGMRSTES